MEEKSHYMKRCMQLAVMGHSSVAPNPMVGCVIVKDGKIIGEGYHRQSGQAHAEINAIQSVADKEALRGAEMYVNLEPCCHFGKTPPCTEKIIEAGIARVFVAGLDPSAKVGGKGLKQLRDAGVIVESGLMEKEEKDLNRRFRTFHQKSRPYIILKWAVSADGFMDKIRGERESNTSSEFEVRSSALEKGRPHSDSETHSSEDLGQFRISNDASQRLLHKWRSEEQAILIGAKTAINDDPSLTVRLVHGRNPIRLILSTKSTLPHELKIMSDGIPSIVYQLLNNGIERQVEYVRLKKREDALNEVMADLIKREILSIIVEGGRETLQSFINEGLWDEARVFKSPVEMKDGLPGPEINTEAESDEDLAGDRLLLYYNRA